MDCKGSSHIPHSLWPVDKLKEFLKEKGLSTTGRKIELDRRVSDRRVGVGTWRGSIQQSTSGEAYHFWGASVFEMEQYWLLIVIAVSVVNYGDYWTNYTAGSPMVGTPITLVQRPISLGLIKDLCNHAITVQRPLKWRKSREESWSCRESNSGPLAYCAECSSTALYLVMMRWDSLRSSDPSSTVIPWFAKHVMITTFIWRSMVTTSKCTGPTTTFTRLQDS